MRLACLLLFTPIFGFSQNGVSNKSGLGAVNLSKSSPAIGFVLPAIKTRNVFSYSSDNIDLSDYRDKLVILDFMQTSCISCLHSLPLLDSLQNRYSDQLKVFLVSREPVGKVKAFLVKSKMARSLSLPWIAADTTLSNLFPYQFISHLVWIRNNKVVAITSSSYVSAQNIELALRNDILPWPVKNDFAGFNYDQPLISVLSEKPCFYSLFYKHQQSIPAKSGWGRVNDQSNRFYAVNYTAVELYLKAFGLPKNFPASRILLDVKNRDRFIYPGNTNKAEWFMQNSYCYETVLPLFIDEQHALQKLRKDLDDYFNLQSSFGMKKINCLLLQPGTVDTSVLCSRSQVPSKSKGWQTIPLLVERMSQLPQTLPVINDTGFANERFLQLPEEVLDNPGKTMDYLCSLGFEFTMGLQEVLVVTIQQKSSLENR